MREELKHHLRQWRFEDARKALDPNQDSIELYDLVEALAAMFTNRGVFDGHMGTLVSYALEPFLNDDRPNPISETPLNR